MNIYFLIYLIGYGLMIAAVWFGLEAAGVSQTWQVVALLFLLGLGIIYAFSRAQTDTAQRDQARTGSGTGSGTGTGTGQAGSQASNAPQQGTSPQQQGGQQQGGGTSQQGQQQSNPPA